MGMPSYDSLVGTLAVLLYDWIATFDREVRGLLCSVTLLVVTSCHACLDRECLESPVE